MFNRVIANFSGNVNEYNYGSQEDNKDDDDDDFLSQTRPIVLKICGLANSYKT